MTIFKMTEEAQKARRAKVEQAIALALRNQWAEAVEVNKSILETTPEDVEALNRLGKGLLELGRYTEGREALEKVVKLAPTNTIARKNLERLAKLDQGNAASVDEQKVPVSLDLFMEETGKSGSTSLVEVGDKGVLHRLIGGEAVLLVQDGSRLVVRSRHNEYIGRVPPRLAQRLISLMTGGNRYVGAILQSNDQDVRIIIREVYQHPSQVGKASFPAPRPDGFRSYVRGRGLVYYDLEEPTIEGVGELGEAEVLEEKPTRGPEHAEEDEEELE